MNNKTTIKKESFYPIDVSILNEGKFFTFKLLKLTERGFIADTCGAILKLASTIPESRFTIPFTDVVISGSLRVMKNYDRSILNEDKTQGIQRLAEFHFQELSSRQRKEIRHFLNQIEQVAT